MALIAFPAAQPESSEREILEAALQQLRDGRLEEAAELYRQTVPQLEQAGDLENLATALDGLSYANTNLGRYQEAANQARQSMEIRRRLGDVPGEAIATVNLGLAHYYLGDYPEALRHYLRALELDTQLDDPESQVLDLNNIGNVHFVQGDYWAALNRYQQAMKIVDQHPDQPWTPYERNNTLANLAALQQKLGRNQQALEVYSQVEQNQLEPGEKAQVLTNLGVLYRHLGDPYKALEVYLQVQQLFQEEGSVDGQIQVLKNIGIAYALDLGDLDRALSIFQEAVNLASQTSNRREETQTRLYVAETLRRLERMDLARRQFERVRESARELGTDEEHWKSLYGLARLELQDGDRALGRTLLEQAVAEIESLRARLRSTSIGSRFLAGKEEVYRALIDLHWERLERAGTALAAKEIDPLLQLLEKARAEPFRDRFWQSLEARQQGAQAERLRGLRREISQLQLRQLREPAKREEIGAEISALENQYLALEVQLRSQLPGFATDPPTLEKIQRSLRSDALLLIYWSSPDAIKALVVGSSTIEFRSAPLRPGERQSLQQCSQQLAAAGSDWRAPCATAGQLLLEPLQTTFETLHPKQLLVLSDSELPALPLEALPLPGGQLAIERYMISYLPSLALPHGVTSKRSPVPWEYSLAAFADPVTSSDPSGSLIDSWKPLAYARAEAVHATEVLPGWSQLFLGKDATKSAWLDSVSRSPIAIHLATHAVSDSEAPERSRILFSPAGPDESSDYLFLGEVVGLPFQGIDLIVLSACETAFSAGNVSGGPDSFALAFLMGGTASVIATQWRVDDRSSAELMQAFYEAIASGRVPAEALRQAKRQLLAHGGPQSHPYYWAGFLLFGESSSALPLPWRWKTIVTALLLIGALTAAAAAWKKRSKT